MNSKEAWRLICRAFADIFRNFSAALRISLPWYLLICILPLVWSHFMRGHPEITYAGRLPFLIALGALLFVFLPSVLAIGWHRFVLREEGPRAVLTFDSDWPIWRFVLNYLIAVIGWVVLFLVGVGIWDAITEFLFGPNHPDGFVSLLGAVFGASVAWYGLLRVGLKLPAVAVYDQHTSFLASWKETRSIRLALVVVAIAMGALQFLPTGLFVHLLGEKANEGMGRFGLLGFLPHAIHFWLCLMLGISMLTTLYAEQVEGRKP